MSTIMESIVSSDHAVQRVNALNWQQISQDLDTQGNAILDRVLSPDECETLAGLYPDDCLFRSRVVMARHGFGRGEYKYFSYPLPGIIADLRTVLYAHLAPIANRWNAAMRVDVRYPENHADFLAAIGRVGTITVNAANLRHHFHIALGLLQAALARRVVQHRQISDVPQRDEQADERDDRGHDAKHCLHALHCATGSARRCATGLVIPLRRLCARSRSLPFAAKHFSRTAANGWFDPANNSVSAWISDPRQP